MTGPDSDRSRSVRPEYSELVTRLGLEELSVENERVRSVVSELDDAVTNGGALVRKFRILDEDGVFEYVQETRNGSVYDLLEHGGFLHDFLRSTELNESVDGLDTEEGFSGYHWNANPTDGIVSGDVASERNDQQFDWFHPLYVDGYLAWVLVRGGAYSSFDGTQAEAKALGRQFEQEVIDGRYESFYAWRLEDVQWSEWFLGVPRWDETLLLVDGAERIVWLFMFTSTD